LLKIFSRLRRGGVVDLLPFAVLLVAVAARLYAAPELIDRLSFVAFDLYQRAAPRESADLPIRIVDLDDASLRRIGQWPWSRAIVAKLIDRLRDDGAAIIALDIDFAEPDRTSPRLLLPLVASTEGEKARQLLEELPDPDNTLATALGTVPVVTGFILTNRDMGGQPAEKAGFAAAGGNPLSRVLTYQGAIPNLPGLEAAAAGNGFLNHIPDWDNVVRRVPLVLKLGDKVVPSLDAEVLRLANGARTYVLRGAGSNADLSFGEKTGLTAIGIGKLKIPTDEAGRVWLHYAKSQPDQYVSAADVLDGTVDRARIQDHLILVGTSAEGLINDAQATPMASGVPGVEIHAQLIEQLLQRSFLVRPDWAPGAEVVFMGLVGIGLIFALRTMGALHSVMLAGTAVAAAIGLSWYAFREAQLLIDPVYPSIVLTTVCLGSSLLGYLRTEAQQREIRNAFSRYTSPRYVDELARHPEKLVLGGERRELTVMFSDIASSTALAESLDPTDLAPLMNGYFTGVGEAIFTEDGYINEFMGDGVLSFFGAPQHQPDHADRAVAAALKIAAFGERYSTEQHARGIPFGHTRIGVHCGVAMVGNLGTESRLKYGALGDVLNIGSRLEGLNKWIGTRICVSEAIVKSSQRSRFRPIGNFVVMGRHEATPVYEPLDTERYTPDHIQRYQAAYEAMEAERPEAAQLFAELYRDAPDDPCVKLHHTRLSAGETGTRIVMTEK
jgi:adenylate cyclase